MSVECTGRVFIPNADLEHSTTQARAAVRGVYPKHTRALSASHDSRCHACTGWHTRTCRRAVGRDSCRAPPHARDGRAAHAVFGERRRQRQAQRRLLQVATPARLGEHVAAPLERLEVLLARPGHRELGHVELHAEVVQSEDGVHDDGHVAQRDLPGEDGARVVAWG
eukprot:scaffold117555_cov118-Phaeocystis_antarctica.AAC.1